MLESLRGGARETESQDSFRGSSGKGRREGCPKEQQWEGVQGGASKGTQLGG